MACTLDPDLQKQVDAGTLLLPDANYQQFVRWMDKHASDPEGADVL